MNPSSTESGRDAASSRPVTIMDLKHMKVQGRKITVLTAYDYPMARMVDQAGIDVVLVGDSLGMVVLGYDSTVPVTMDEMIHHCKAVRRGVRRAFLVGDMPYLSYQVTEEEAVRNAGRFIKEAGCQGVKLEGGAETAPTVERLVHAGIPVMGHIGLTPQTATALGGYKVQGRDMESARRLVDGARALVSAGVFALVMECVPTVLARAITETVSVPTIGIGAGPHCDGQVLVVNDILGLFDRFVPSFVQRYATLAPQIMEALARYAEEVRMQAFPRPDHGFGGGEDLLEALFGH